jgi:hypothetical protein
MGIWVALKKAFGHFTPSDSLLVPRNDSLGIEDLSIKKNLDHQLWGMIFADMGGKSSPDIE